MCFSWSYTLAVQEVQARESKLYYCERNGFIGAGGTIALCRMVANRMVQPFSATQQYHMGNLEDDDQADTAIQCTA